MTDFPCFLQKYWNSRRFYWKKKESRKIGRGQYIEYKEKGTERDVLRDSEKSKNKLKCKW